LGREVEERFDEDNCYESPKKEIVSYVIEHLIHNIKMYNGVKI